MKIQAVFPPKHKCCDICAKDCVCEDCDHQNCSNEWWEINPSCETDTSEVHFELSLPQKSELSSRLHNLRETTIEGTGHSGPDLLSGFPRASVEQVINIAKPDITMDDIIIETSIFNDNVIPEIVNIVRDVLQSTKGQQHYDHDTSMHLMNSPSSSSQSSDSESHDSSDNISSDDSAKYHVQLDDSSNNDSDF